MATDKALYTTLRESADKIATTGLKLTRYLLGPTDYRKLSQEFDSLRGKPGVIGDVANLYLDCMLVVQDTFEHDPWFVVEEA